MDEVKDLDQIQDWLHQCLKSLGAPLQVRKEGERGLEIAGTKRVMQGKQEVDGFYFASTVCKPKDIRLYFFPIYTDPDLYELSADLEKMLKGKSCFHIKRLNDDLKSELQSMMEAGKRRYEEKGHI